nr:hypothetical protein [Tanacetum cinerariifolium]GEW35307.1 hypothetical protein [Tanacetum cinerariifolium]
AAMEKLVEKLGNAEDKVECKKLKRELEEARFSNTFPRMQNERNHASKVCTFDSSCYSSKIMSMLLSLLSELGRQMLEMMLVELDQLGNNQRQGNARAMVTAPTDGKLPLCERCFTRHVGQCTIKCHKCRKVGHKSRMVKQEEVGEVCGRSYATKDVEPKGPNVVTGMFLFNNRYAFVLFDSGSNWSFVDNRFSSMLDIDPVKIGASYEVELEDGKVVSTNTVLKGCTLNLLNHVFEIDLMPIELGMFNVIIDMAWLVKHDAVIICGERVVRILYGNKILIVKSDKGMSRLKKRMEDVPVICDFLEVFPEELPGLPPSRQVEFRIDLVPRAVPVTRAPYRLAPSEMKELSVHLLSRVEQVDYQESISSFEN